MKDIINIVKEECSVPWGICKGRFEFHFIEPFQISVSDRVVCTWLFKPGSH